MIPFQHGHAGSAIFCVPYVPKGAYPVGDRATGKGLTITLWETKEDADAMNAALPQTLALFDGMFAAQPSLETYEVLLQV